MEKRFNHFGELYWMLKRSSPKDDFIHDLHEEQWKVLSKKDFLQNIRYLTLAFFENDWSGKQVAIAVSSSSVWLMLDYALMLSGAVSVPLFTNISSKNLRYQLLDAHIQTVFIENEEQERVIHQADESLEVIYVSQDTCGNRTLDMLLAQGKVLDEGNPTLFAELLGRIHADDLATIVYTSGTSGNPKGVELSHSNLISQVKATAENYYFEKNRDIAFSFLPLAHIFERMVMHFYISREVSIYFADDVKNVGVLLKEINPTVMTVVPRLLEKVYFKMKTKAMEGNVFKRGLVMLAFHRAGTKDPEKSMTLLDRLLDRLVYTKLRLAFGKSMRMMISGGAPLSDMMYRFYLNIGVNVYQGYGLTESSPVIASNTPKENRVGTCGKAFPHVEVKLNEEGELLVRGLNIMLGYHNNMDATFEAIDQEGWLHTGDLASLDDEGYISITGRVKELLKTSTGKYVSSVYIEQALKKNGWFEQALVLGEAKPYVAALLFIEHEYLGRLAKKMHTTPLKALQSKKFKTMTEKYIKGINKKLNHWEKVREYTVLADELSIEEDFLTPSMKLAKEAVMLHYSAEIDEMYKDHV